MSLSMSEILQEINDRRKNTDRVELLQKYDSQVLRGVLFVALRPELVRWALPEGVPPYKPSEALDNQSFFFTEWEKLYVFLADYNLPAWRREQLFIQLLEALTPDDALLMISLKEGKMPYTNIKDKVVDMAFPGLLPARLKKTG